MTEYKPYFLGVLVPVEEIPNLESIKFFTQVHRNGHDFKFLDMHDTPTIHNINGVCYIAGGNQRAIWHALNRDLFLYAKEEPGDTMKDVYERISRRNKARGITNVFDLALTVKLPVTDYDVRIDLPPSTLITRKQLKKREWIKIS